MKKLLKILLTLAIIAGIVIYGPQLYHKYFPNNSYKDVAIYMDPVSDDEISSSKNEFENELKAMSSEIEGMSAFDKYEKGLDPFTEDTDADGLSDNDELNVYHSNPLKKSTAGDLYSDGYKVENGMDIFTYTEYEGEFEFPNVSVDNVIPVAKSLDEAVISISSNFSTEDMEKLSDDMNRNIYQVIYVNNNEYQIPVSINVEDILTKKGITTDDIEVTYCQSIKFFGSKNYSDKKAEFGVEGKNILVNATQFNTEESGGNPNSYYIVISDNKKLNNLLSMFSSKDSSEQLEIINQKGLAYAESEPFSFRFYKWNKKHSNVEPNCVKLYYYDTGNNDVNEKAINEIKEQYCDEFIIDKEKDSEKYASFCQLIKVDDYKDVLNKCIKYNDSPFNVNKGRGNAYEIARGVWKAYATSYNLLDKEDIKPADVIEKQTTFDIDTEIFPFTNFVSQRKDNGKTIGGHCAAIATITAKTHNGSYVEEKGSWNSLANSANSSTAFLGYNSWDLSVDNENLTLRDKGLSDFKSESFVDGKGNITEEGVGVSEFINLADCYLEEYNNYSKLSELMNLSGKNKDKYPFYNAEQMMSYLDNDKILVAGFLDNRMGHVVNIYAYTVLENGDIEFSIYDNNHPSDRSLKMIVTKSVENPYYMDFIYESPDHVWSSEAGNCYKLIITDENMYFVTDVKRLQSENGEIEAMPHNNTVANKEIEKIRNR